jgi:hypothetical protein
MFMPKKPLSDTLDQTNLLWLKGRAAGRKKRSLSDALDDILTQARQGGYGGDVPRSVVGTVDIAADDPGLDRADVALQSLFDESLTQPFLVRETTQGGVATTAKKTTRKGRRG